MPGAPFPATPPQFWLRSYQITITTPGGTYTISNSEYESLRVTFKVDMYIYPLKSFWQSEVSIYNLSASVLGQILKTSVNMNNPAAALTPLNTGNTVSLSAGYQFGSSGAFNPQSQLLFTGRLFQPILTREGVVDYKLRLRCISALVEDIWNMSNLSLPGGTTGLLTLQSIASNAQNPIPIEKIDDNAKAILGNSKQPGSQCLVGRPCTHIENIAYSNNLFAWLSPKGLNIRSFGPTDFQDLPAYAYGPPNLPGPYAPNGTTTGVIKKTLIDTPQQTQDGVSFKVLLDSTPKIGDLVQLAPGTIISPVATQYGANSLPAIPSATGVYIVGGIHHEGDSRGRDEGWYTEILGLSVDYFTNWLGARTPGANQTGVLTVPAR